jgi:hypothetical protein
MTTAVSTTALATIQPAFTDAERLALAGFLAGYRGLTREAYALDLRQFTAWCRARSMNLLAVRRADIDSFARELEARGRARATVTRRLCTIAGFYKYAIEEELLDHSPAAHVRRPRVDYESHAVALDRNELGALLVAAGLGTRDAVGGSRIRQRRPEQGPDPGLRHQAEHHLRPQGEFRHPGYVKSRRAVQDSLPEGCRGRLVADIEDQVHRADHVTDDNRTYPRASLVKKRLPQLPHTEMADLRRVSHAGSAGTEPH